MRHSTYTAWHNIGRHETPPSLAEEFAELIGQYITEAYRKQEMNSELRILDIFAGDGRLGNIVSKSLCSLFKSIHVTFVEIDFLREIEIAPCISDFEIIKKNVFTWHSKDRFDLVVSNPPYLMINAKRAKELGLPWNRAKVWLRNLYGLGISRGLELCKEGGLLGVIAPFSWLRGFYGRDFREEISKICSDVYVKGNNHRGIFRGAVQDTGIQIFRKKLEKGKGLGVCEWRFCYHGSEIFDLGDDPLNLDSNQEEKSIKVRVGPIVWNRKKDFLRSDAIGSVLLIYGGNIRPKGILDTTMKRYAEKQYVRTNALNPGDTLKAPFILIRRTLRGEPGNWKIDSCLVIKEMECTAENHVIVVELTNPNISPIDLHDRLIEELNRYYYVSGSPSISANVVRMLSTMLKL